MTPLGLALSCTGPSGAPPKPSVPTSSTAETGLPAWTPPSAEPAPPPGDLIPDASRPIASCDPAASLPPFEHCGCATSTVTLGGTIGDHGHAMASNGAGVVVAGAFSKSITFGKGEAAETTLVASGVYSDGFVAAYRPNGTLLWARQQEDARASMSEAVAAHVPSGRVAVQGLNFSEVTLEGGGTEHVLPYDFDDQYIATYDNAGTLEWAVAVTSGLHEFTGDVAFGPAGELYAVGWTEASLLDFTSTNGSTLHLTDLGPEDNGETSGFLVRIEPDGTLAWVQVLGGPGVQKAQRVVVGDDGRIVVAGLFTLSMTFDPGGEHEQTLTAIQGATPAFVAQYSPTGALSWAQMVDSESANDVADVVALDGGAFGLAGYFGNLATWGGGTAAEQVVAPRAGTLGWFASSGELTGVWPFYQQVAGTDGAIGALALARDPRLSRFAFAGLQQSEGTFGLGEPREITVQADPKNTNAWDPLLLVLDDAGQLDCFWHLDGTAPFDQARGVAFDDEGGVWVTGSFDETLTVGQGRPDAKVFHTAKTGLSDVFLVRFQVHLAEPEPPDTADTGR